MTIRVRIEHADKGVDRVLHIVATEGTIPSPAQTLLPGESAEVWIHNNKTVTISEGHMVPTEVP